MNLTIFLEQRMLQSPDKSVWSPMGYGRQFWDRYLRVFSNVTVCARVLPVNEIPDNYVLVNGDHVSVTPLPYYVGPWEYLRLRSVVKQKAVYALQKAETLILRVPSQIGWQLHSILESTGRPYGVEVVGDPWDVFAPGSVKIFARPLFRRLFSYRLRTQCQGAAAALYVTKSALQKRYPVKNGLFATHASNVELPDIAFASSKKHFSNDGILRIVYVGTLAQMYKAPDVLIKAVAKLIQDGCSIRLTMAGGGCFQSNMEDLAKTLNIREFVDFTGILSAGEEVRDQLDRADIFILPSFQEGLPRAMIEAMARGLPCIGSSVGGIPELLPQDSLVPAGNVGKLAKKIKMFISSPQYLQKSSKENLRISRQYHKQILTQRRCDFYKYLAETTKQYHASYQERFEDSSTNE